MQKTITQVDRKDYASTFNKKFGYLFDFYCIHIHGLTKEFSDNFQHRYFNFVQKGYFSESDLKIYLINSIKSKFIIKRFIEGRVIEGIKRTDELVKDSDLRSRLKISYA